MKLSMDLACSSSQEWLQTVLSDFDAFLQDHANCERKASAMALSFVAKYPNRVEILPELIDIAIEELEHFKQVYELMERRGVQLPEKMGQDPYAKALVDRAQNGRDGRFLDRLLIASVAECRGAERFRMVMEGLTDPELKEFYKRLWISEAKHGHVFVKMALIYFSEEEVYDRLRYWVAEEAKVIQGLSLRPALH